MSDWTASRHYPSNAAIAHIQGGPPAPGIRGTVYFTEAPGGSWVSVNLSGLPPYRPAVGMDDPIGPHGFHIHENGTCAIGDPNDPFLPAGQHWNPDCQPHGNHAGDFPVVFSNHGQAMMAFYTDRFQPSDVIGKSVLLHLNPNDYRTQPAGDSGKRVACGVIEPYR